MNTEVYTLVIINHAGGDLQFVFYLPLKGATGKVGLARKKFAFSVVKSTRKARGFAPLCPQLQL